MLESLKNAFSPKGKTHTEQNNKLIDQMSDSGFSLVGDSLDSCGPVKFTYDLMYKIQRFNTEAQAGKDKVAKMVGKRGVQFLYGDRLTDSKNRSKKVYDLMSNPLNGGDFFSTKDMYYTNHFSSGMVFGYIGKNGLGEPVVQILDSRHVHQNLDEFGNVKSIFYGGNKLNLDRLIKQVTKYDPNRPGQGMSSYETVVYDALSDKEAGKRNFYFFKNNAMPSVILSMDKSINNPEEVKNAIKNFEDKYKGTEKSHGVLATGGIREVRTVDFNNKDLELLELKRFAIKKMGVVFGVDPRFLGYKDDKNGSHSEYQIMANQSDKSMLDFADIFENFVYTAMRRVYGIKFSFDGINFINDQFLDKIVKQELIEKKVEKGLCTLKQGIEELGYDTRNVPDYMDTYIINTQWASADSLFNKGKLEQERTKKEIEQMENKKDDQGEEKKEAEEDKNSE